MSEKKVVIQQSHPEVRSKLILCSKTAMHPSSCTIWQDPRFSRCLISRPSFTCVITGKE